MLIEWYDLSLDQLLMNPTTRETSSLDTQGNPVLSPNPHLGRDDSCLSHEQQLERLAFYVQHAELHGFECRDVFDLSGLDNRQRVDRAQSFSGDRIIIVV